MGAQAQRIVELAGETTRYGITGKLIMLAGTSHPRHRAPYSYYLHRTPLTMASAKA
jgi:hypothetical protein